MAIFNFLHLTDLHFGMKYQEWLWPNFRQEFYDDLERIVETAGPWDAVVFSGDLSQTGSKDDFAQLTEALNGLWIKFKSLGSDPCFICVPGNHDLSRPLSHNSVVKALKNWHKDNEIRNIFWDSADNEYRKLIEDTFLNYSNWLSSLEIRKPDKIIPGCLPGDFSVILPKGDLKIGFAGLNTSFLQLTDENYQGKLDLHVRQLFDVCSGDPVKWRQELDIAFLLTHHNFNWLNSKAQKIFKSEIATPGRFFAHICGHMHEPCHLSQKEYGGEEQRLWQGPSLFGLKNYGREIKELKERMHGYCSCRVELIDCEGIVTLWPRKMNLKYAGHGKLGPDIGYDLNENNTITHDFNSQNKSKKASDKNIHNLKLTTKSGEEESQHCCEQGGIENTVTIDNIDLPYYEGKLSNVPQLLLKSEPQYIGIHIEEQIKFKNILLTDRCIWLVSDWGQGKLGFLGSSIGKLSDEQKIYHLQCEEIESIDDLLLAFEEQLGITLQEFVNISTKLVLPILYIEKIPTKLFDADSNNLPKFESLINSIIDYNNKMLLILDTRKPVKKTTFANIELKALDLPDVRSYVTSHPESTPGIINVDTIEHLYTLSDGLPMFLDHLIKSLKVSTLKDLINLELEVVIGEYDSVEPVPKALMQAIASIAQSPSRYSRRSFKLLKILSILSTGETLLKIKRFDNSDPFFPENALELSELNLIDIIQLINPAPEIEKSTCVLDVEAPRLLRVPKQVRDYVKSLINADEYSSIINKSADLLFGDNWKEGKIKTYQSDVYRMRGARPTGPGNEHTVARYLLWEAVQKNDFTALKRAMLLSVAYIRRLHSESRFKDACIAAEESLNILGEIETKTELFDLYLEYGKSLRMTGKRSEAIDVLRKITENEESKKHKDTCSSALLNIALAYQSQGNKKEALESAKQVTKIDKKGSPYYDQAIAIVIECDNDCVNKKEQLKHLETKARRSKRSILANNITLTLAKMTKSVDDKISLYNKIIDCNEDIYNKIRAVVNKTEVLIESDMLLELRFKDKLLLQVAYTYLYSQRLDSLFNKCHRVIWELLERWNKHHQLLRLFRYSSFLWRIRGELETENNYLDRIADKNYLQSNDGFEFDLNYYNARKVTLTSEMQKLNSETIS